MKEQNLQELQIAQSIAGNVKTTRQIYLDLKNRLFKIVNMIHEDENPNLIKYIRGIAHNIQYST